MFEEVAVAGKAAECVFHATLASDILRTQVEVAAKKFIWPMKP